MSYHEHTVHQYAKHIRAGAPDAFKSFIAWDAEVLRGSNKVISTKNTELMAVAVVVNQHGDPEEKVQAAIANCPTQAISLVEVP